MDFTDATLPVEPRSWVLVFVPSSDKWWVRWLARGRYKHVRAYAYLPAFKAWLFYDVNFSGVSIRLAVDCEETTRTTLWAFVDGCDLVRFDRRLLPGNNPVKTPLFGWCVPSIKHLIGLRSRALRPDALHRDVIAAGGVPV